ncbi:MAG: glycoside hydrolase family 36 protein [Ktedonobacteraceae bacterium]
MNLETLQRSQAIVRLCDGRHAGIETISISKAWHGERCRTKVTNHSQDTIHIQEVVLFSGPLTLDLATAFYGEGFQMLSQTAGTLGAPLNIGAFTDHGHYKISQQPGTLTAYNLVTLSPSPTEHILLAFTSCHRFSGLFRFGADWFEIVLDTEGMPLAPQETWEMEEFLSLTGPERDPLLFDLAACIAHHHPRLTSPVVPTGWCSWYGYGPDISEQVIVDNMQTIATHIPNMTYIQIDDGYAQAMGDWLIPSPHFPHAIKELCQRIRDQGFEPAIWVAPFIAEREAQIFKEHPDWFVKNDTGTPLLSSTISFGGWRKGPWYMLDGTHPQVQNHLERLFRIMREEWDCRYFKLDALTWGALHGGQRYDPSATRIQAYRRGMRAIQRGAGSDSFILGCNAPLWPSLGLVHGMRTTGDIARSWKVIASIARECFWRNWQHQQLWINDPDCVVLENGGPNLLEGDGELSVTNQVEITTDEFLFHATVIYASGGMVFSGDKISHLPEDKRAILRKLLLPTGIAAQFDDTTFRIGRIHLADRQMLCLFNWSDKPCDLEVPLPLAYHISDYWTEEDLGFHKDLLRFEHMPPHSARLLICQLAQ